MRASGTPESRPRFIADHGEEGGGHTRRTVDRRAYECDRVPAELARLANSGRGMPVGSPGKVGVLELTFGVRGNPQARTELTHHYQKTPLQIMRPLYYDRSRPDMPYTYVMTIGGGVLHGDRQRMDITVEAGAAAHVTTQAHTKIHRMHDGYATSIVNLDVGPGAYLEYLPDPIIPFAESRYYQQTRVTLDPEATLVVGETVYAGRLSRGERHEYEAYATDLEVVRPDGEPVLIDRARLLPGHRGVTGLGVLADHDVILSFYVLTPSVSAEALSERFQEALTDLDAPDAHWGVSAAPGGAGAWVRLVCDDTVVSTAAGVALWQAARHLLTGRAPTDPIRK
ncbi:urease accessory protein UreD [Gordonia jinghuaiqii]|uniref:Urease accessory protein UreD n=1 Tax=Gordonia jinghuaiqii TaxID=2758710 RepID=A0A7D7R4C3_9ACTN|nr:urease accessory protein UreD [Gordonia jinghuaiqii]MCR5978564.1 urease accessory protein UreD [Gordonia jinghuaiqii]QMT02887.1 urease accessory protein UreD [Gordonia jinghuaiqii]